MIVRTPGTRDRWLVSYADIMTLLCACFVTLYAASAVQRADAPTARAAVASLPAAPPATSESDRVRRRLEQVLGVELGAGRVRLVDDPRGLVIEIPEMAAFEPGSAELSGEARGTMTRLADVLATLPHSVRVEGHTDDTPIASPRFQSNWDLSTTRATAVVAVFLAAGPVAPERLSAAGYAEFRPRASNQTPDGRARNRRVDVVVLDPVASADEEPLVDGGRR